MPGDIRAGGIYIDFVANTARFVGNLKQTSAALRRQSRAYRALRRDVRALNRAGRNLVTGIFSLRGAVLGLLGIGGITSLGIAFVRAADTMTLLNARLQVVTGTGEEFIKVQRGIFQVSQETRVGITSLTDLYARFGRSTKNLGISSNDLLRSLRVTSQAVVVSGATTREANQALIQFSQGLAAGALRGDEFRAVAEQLPRLANAIGDSLGLTIGQLRSLAHVGELTSARIIAALLEQSDVLQKEFAQIPRTVGQAFVQLQNRLIQLSHALSQEAGLGGELIASLDRLRGLVAQPQIYETFIAILGRIASGFTLVVAHINQLIHVMIIAFGVLLTRLPIVRATVSVLRVILVELTNVRAALIFTANTFLRFYVTSWQVGLTALRNQIELFKVLLQVRWIQITDIVRAAAVRIRHPLATMAAAFGVLRASALNVNTAIRALSVTLKTGLAVAATAANFAVRGLTLAFTTLLRVVRVFSGLIIVEAIFLTIRSIFVLNREVLKAGTTLSNALKVLAADILQTISNTTITAIESLIRGIRAALDYTGAIIVDFVVLVVGGITKVIKAQTVFITELALTTVGIFTRLGIAVASILARQATNIVLFLGTLARTANRFGARIVVALSAGITSAVTGGDFTAAFAKAFDFDQFKKEANAQIAEIDFSLAKPLANLQRDFALAGSELVKLAENFQAKIRSSFDTSNFGVAALEAYEAALKTNQLIDLLPRINFIAKLGLTEKELKAVRVALKATGEEGAEFVKILLGLIEVPATLADEWEKFQETVGAGLETNARIGKEFLDTLKGGFEDFLTTAITAFDNVEEAARQFARNLIDILVRKLITEQLASGISGLLVKAFPFIGKIGAGTGVGKKQHGGQARGLTLVGEGGPELVDFRRPGQVYPNDVLRDIVRPQGGGGIQVVNVIQSDDEAAVERAMARALPILYETVKAAVSLDGGRPSAIRTRFRYT